MCNLTDQSVFTFQFQNIARVDNNVLNSLSTRGRTFPEAQIAQKFVPVHSCRQTNTYLKISGFLLKDMAVNVQSFTIVQQGQNYASPVQVEHTRMRLVRATVKGVQQVRQVLDIDLWFRPEIACRDQHCLADSYFTHSVYVR